MHHWTNGIHRLAILAALLIGALTAAESSRANPGTGVGNKNPHAAPAQGVSAMHGMAQGDMQQTMPHMATAATERDQPEPHEGTLADAEACRRALMAGRDTMGNHQMQDCITLVSKFEGAGGGKVVTIYMNTDAQGRNFFEPARVEIDRGDTVKWVNVFGVHNTAAYPDRIPRAALPWEAPLLAANGQSYARTFFNVGTHEYHCHPHETVGMKGVVVVERESRPGEFRPVKDAEAAHAHQ